MAGLDRPRHAQANHRGLCPAAALAGRDVVGVAAGQWLIARRPDVLGGPLHPRLHALATIGRWPLTIYMLHQPCSSASSRWPLSGAAECRSRAGPATIDNHDPSLLFGFHAVAVRLKTAPATVGEVHFDASRHDQRMRTFSSARARPACGSSSNDARLATLCGSARHQGVAARVAPLPRSHSLDDTLDAVAGMPLLLVLDGVTDPHNLGACLRDRRRRRRMRWLRPRTTLSASMRRWPRWRAAPPRRCPISWSPTWRARWGKAEGTLDPGRRHVDAAPRSLSRPRPPRSRWRWCSAPRAAACVSSPRAAATNWCTCRCAAGREPERSASPRASACTRRCVSASGRGRTERKPEPADPARVQRAGQPLAERL